MLLYFLLRVNPKITFLINIQIRLMKKIPIKKQTVLKSDNKKKVLNVLRSKTEMVVIPK